MYKKILLLTMGFGMITLGVTGVTRSLLDRETKADLQQLEKAQQETVAAATEERRILDEKRQEIEKMTQNTDTERKRLEEERRAVEKDRRALDETYRSKMFALETQKRAVMEAKSVPPKAAVKGKSDKNKTKQTALSRKGRKPEKRTVSAAGNQRGRTVTASRTPVQDEALRQVARKAGFQAARLFQPVQYQSRRTGELIVAEPFDYGPGSVRVRVRVWKSQRLVQDTVMSFSEALLHRAGRPHA